MALPRTTSNMLRLAARPTTTPSLLPRTSPSFTTTTRRTLSTAPRLYDDSKNDPYHKQSTAATGTSAGPHEGSSSRTDNQISFEYPDDGNLGVREAQVQGRGGVHLKRTLATFSLEGRTAVITGGARGLGLVMGQALVNSGADLAIVDMNKEEAEHQTQAMIEQFKKENPKSEEYDRAKFDLGKKEGVFRIPKITAHYSDVSDPDSVNSCFQEILSSHGKVDHLVTSAGFTENFSAETYPYDRIKKLWGVNVDGTYLFCTALANHLLSTKRPGSMVMIGSMSGSIVNVPQPQAPYNAAKAAIRHLAASLAVEWAHAGIRVNCISPGYMLTALTRKILDENPDLAKKWTSLIPQGKMGRPEDLMGAVTYLLSDASGYVTGADLRVDGGYTCT
ncbi:D-arabinitol 2-dehydrogenase [ribulose-forming] [Cyphellophora attinorum]|uniref:D-arabinitol 2-dehydrogenase [ribulose-forming] n=1 Tax=Cyphellophora attinorum TaxID=1664694 RepID=A0A0N1HW08_9EURO|nr:D-arabinitol 2-dehydrogenase [ribulose-forming] [Phialophora attinorum]KPI41645.1 D-arabinitol 2-dehydrogenase [ribulose-forming] [Phialophora attinorum]